ncbi:cell division protein ZapA [Altericroceibacterium spongiae]|uniref:Cell division protein ZapA n=1 Tax=Altericroceibacterium spongiae TaxID=2320269 RepID=A0A420ER87_9SPHN|nr:cell division protein ZapA [Altericroceibacterium spongiae]RKF23195.1 cell division protein ZapA [Altericroceibacterium spongiae]
MSNIELTIGGRPQRIACAPGQEGHIRKLGLLIDEALSQVAISGQSEARAFLYASLILADQVQELHKRLAEAETQPAPPAADMPPQLEAEIAEALEKLAQRLESAASHLEEAEPIA